MVFICSLFGLPWLCTGVVQTLSHVHSLTVTKKSSAHKNEHHAEVDYVIEQRVTCILVGVLHGKAIGQVGIAVMTLKLMFSMHYIHWSNPAFDTSGRPDWHCHLSWHHWLIRTAIRA